MASNNKSKQVNRAAIIDQNFIDHVNSLESATTAFDLSETGMDRTTFLELFESQIMSRQLDLMARELRLENKVFYTIGSSGHEGNTLLGRLTRHTDPAFLHYRSGGFMMERSRKVDGIDPVHDTALSFAASSEDPASGGRHKVWGSKPLWVLPQTSTIASHLPKAVGSALGIELARRSAVEMAIPEDAITVCNFGDASANHSTAQGAFNAAQWAAYQGLAVPVLFVCEDNGIGISVRTPDNWIKNSFQHRRGMQYFAADGLDLARGYRQVETAVNYCRHERKPVFLHLKTTRLMGHAGTDFEVDYRDLAELEAAEAADPLLRSAELAVRSGVMTPDEIIDMYHAMHERCMQSARAADKRPRLENLDQVIEPLAPYDETAVNNEASRRVEQTQRLELFGSEKGLPENQGGRHMAILINKGLSDLMLKYPNTLIFGEDVAQKGGVYTLTRQLMKQFSNKRVFNTLLDEQTILGLAQGYANLGFLPIPEIQYLAYFHNACDQIRGEAASLQFFSNNQFANPMVVRIPSLGYQKGFGGHFHNDNSISALRDIPGVLVACPSRGDDAVRMMRSCMALSKVNGRVILFLEPIALYMHKDLHTEGDNAWCFDYPAPEQAIQIGMPGLYDTESRHLLVITYGNGVPMSLKAARQLADEGHGLATVMDLRWLQPLHSAEICEIARDYDGILIVDEGRASAGVGEGVVSLLVAEFGTDKAISKITGADCFTPLGDASQTVLPSVDSVRQAIESALSQS